MKKLARKKYDALGFVEALISILVAGTASIVLMSIAIDTMTQVLQNEVADSLTEKAIKGSVAVRSIAVNHNNSTDALFPPISGNEGKCFAFSDTDPASFYKSSGVFTQTCSYDSPNADDCRAYTIPSNTDMFRVFCITANSDSSSGLVVGKVVTGLTKCRNQIDRGDCSVPDYQYYTLFKVTQR